MSVSLFDTDAPHGEASKLVAFSTNMLDRRSEHRTDTDLADALAKPGTRAFAIARGRILLSFEKSQSGEALFPIDQLATLSPDPAEAILLGWTLSGQARIALPCNIDPETLAGPMKALDPRSIYRQGLLDQETQGALAQGYALLAWAQTTKFCGKCGGAMKAEAGGYKRVCSQCSLQAFPRTDPVAIMLAIDEERDLCLLGRSPHFPPGMFSCLAGFIEPGETIEDAVRRETLEESGIRIGRVRYHASQPWPMPHSLMIGAYAEATSTEIARDTAELEDCRWFTRDEAAAMLASLTGETQLSSPPPGAIAHRLIRDWLDFKR